MHRQSRTKDRETAMAHLGLSKASLFSGEVEIHEKLENAPEYFSRSCEHHHLIKGKQIFDENFSEKDRPISHVSAGGDRYEC
jgi:hypothetical protein